MGIDELNSASALLITLPGIWKLMISCIIVLRLRDIYGDRSLVLGEGVHIRRQPLSPSSLGFSRNLKYKGGGFKTQRKKEMKEIIKMGINLCFVGGSLKMGLEV